MRQTTARPNGPNNRRSILKKILKRLFHALGLDVRRAGDIPAPHPGPTIADSYAQLKRLGFQPGSVIDVGVADGTPELHEAFSDVFHVLIEPVPQHTAAITKILKTLNGVHIQSAAGAKSGKAKINVHDDELQGSSLLNEAMGPEADGHVETVSMVQLDDLPGAIPRMQKPYLIKVDVQGAELQVLEGAREIMQDAEAIVLEVSLFEFLKGAPQLHDVVAYLKAVGFVVYDIIRGWNRPLDRALGQVDMVFVKENGRFRESHYYATPMSAEKPPAANPSNED
jgi:FkbM family methyltransferase